MLSEYYNQNPMKRFFKNREIQQREGEAAILRTTIAQARLLDDAEIARRHGNGRRQRRNLNWRKRGRRGRGLWHLHDGDRGGRGRRAARQRVLKHNDAERWPRNGAARGALRRHLALSAAVLDGDGAQHERGRRGNTGGGRGRCGRRSAVSPGLDRKRRHGRSSVRVLVTPSGLDAVA